MSPRDILVHHVEKVGSTIIKGQIGGRTKGRIGSQTDRRGKTLERAGTGSPKAKQVIGTIAGWEQTTKTDNRDFCTFKCNLSCCKSCTYCTLAFTIERNKSWVSRLSRVQIKVCEKCFLCHSIVLCQTCNKCTICCLKSACRGETSKLLASLAGSGGGLKVVQIREGYTLPFWIRPKLTRSSRIISCYANPHRNSNLFEALHQLIDKKCRASSKPSISGLFQPTFPGTKTQQQMETDVSRCQQSKPKYKNSKWRHRKTIRTSLQQGEWVTSVDFKDAYFQIPIQEQSRKYLRFHIQNRSYQFKALPLGLSTAPLEFTVIAKEVKLMAIHKGIRIYQYLDDWLVRARSH